MLKRYNKLNQLESTLYKNKQGETKMTIQQAMKTIKTLLPADTNVIAEEINQAIATILSIPEYSMIEKDALIREAELFYEIKLPMNYFDLIKNPKELDLTALEARESISLKRLSDTLEFSYNKKLFKSVLNEILGDLDFLDYLSKQTKIYKTAKR